MCKLLIRVLASCLLLLGLGPAAALPVSVMFDGIVSGATYPDDTRLLDLYPVGTPVQYTLGFDSRLFVNSNEPDPGIHRISGQLRVAGNVFALDELFSVGFANDPIQSGYHYWIDARTLGAPGRGKTIFRLLRYTMDDRYQPVSSEDWMQAFAFSIEGSSLFSYVTVQGDFNVSSVPLPPALWLMSAGLASLGVRMRLQRAQRMDT